mmetsp:Transcript_18341/g.41954  ORF Transcript_18341/g.41954 Transcript_18341/m.41954 type:complete len:209 (-) Transcript_18341:765-1391(-)
MIRTRSLRGGRPDRWATVPKVRRTYATWTAGAEGPGAAAKGPRVRPARRAWRTGPSSPAAMQVRGLVGRGTGSSKMHRPEPSFVVATPVEVGRTVAGTSQRLPPCAGRTRRVSSVSRLSRTSAPWRRARYIPASSSVRRQGRGRSSWSFLSPTNATSSICSRWESSTTGTPTANADGTVSPATSCRDVVLPSSSFPRNISLVPTRHAG